LRPACRGQTCKDNPFFKPSRRSCPSGASISKPNPRTGIVVVVRDGIIVSHRKAEVLGAQLACRPQQAIGRDRSIVPCGNGGNLCAEKFLLRIKDIEDRALAGLLLLFYPIEGVLVSRDLLVVGGNLTLGRDQARPRSADVLVYRTLRRRDGELGLS